MSGQSSLPAALVTGAAGGIGAAIVDRFIERGLRVLAVDRDAPGLAALQRRSPQHAAVVAACIDVADPHAMNSAVAVFGELDFAVLNAGIEGRVAPVDVYPSADFEEVMRVNVRGVWCGMQSVIPTLERRGAGGIVIISSINGIRGFGTFAAYAASKQAEMGLARTAAIDLAQSGIRVNSVHPGLVDTQMMQIVEDNVGAVDRQAARAAFNAFVPLGRYAAPAEIAHVAAFLLSDQASYVTGAGYIVDGGFTTGIPAGVAPPVQHI
jgi:NAD(P)-dependent dehydrogenase (short-subunit alcohol dehydrogenase family)